jgi:hypothetical protein
MSTQSAPRRRALVPALIVANGLLLFTAALRGEPVTVRHAEGVVHGFLVLRTLAGATIASGDLVQDARGGRVTTRVTFHFKDGSTQDETAVFSQHEQFRLVEDRVVQRGPSFPRPLDMSIDAGAGVVTVRYSDDGKEKSEAKHLDLPPDLANGLVPTLLKNVDRSAPPRSLSYVVATPAPRLIKLAIAAAGQEQFSLGGQARQSTHYVLHPEIGGIAGALAGLVGKQPPDSHVWILGGSAPAFVRSEQPLYAGGPLWRIELVAPEWHEPSMPDWPAATWGSSRAQAGR